MDNHARTKTKISHELKRHPVLHQDTVTFINMFTLTTGINMNYLDPKLQE